jgi:hypothetical protein
MVMFCYTLNYSDRQDFVGSDKANVFVTWRVAHQYPTNCGDELGDFQGKGLLGCGDNYCSLMWYMLIIKIKYW